MSRLTRTPLVALASLTLVVQVAGLAHEALVPHVVCAEHGEWIDGSPSSAAPQSDFDGVRRAADQVASPAHEHCAVLAHRRTPTRAGAPTLTAGVATAPVLTVVAPRAVPLGSLEPLDVAPKASPPARS